MMSDETDPTIPTPPDKAKWGMTIMMIILVIVAFFFCIVPVYRLIKKRRTYWDQIENDPRWNVDHFQFSSSAGHSHAQVQDIGRCNRLGAQENIPGMNNMNQWSLPRKDEP
jgi:hypothetical protein